MITDCVTADERCLVHLLLSGNRPVTERFVRNNTDWMLSLARRYVRDDALAEDCVQESFECAFRALSKFEGHSRLRSWMQRIVINACLLKLRSLRRRREVPLFNTNSENDDESAREPACGSPSPLEMLERNETSAIVLSGIDRLPASYRDILRTRDIDELETRDAAAVLGITETNLKVRLHRARRALRTVIERDHRSVDVLITKTSTSWAETFPSDA